jgi:glycosyltransferase involved in cell wall biosynthesis
MTMDMKILMTTDTVGGVWTYALELARSLAEHGVQFWLATMGAPLSDCQRAAAAAVDNVTVYESRYKLEWMQDPWSDVFTAGRWLLDLERRIRPDVVHLNGYAHGSLPWLAPALVVAHSCVCSWWQAVKHEPAPPAWNRYRENVSNGLHAAAAVVAPSHHMLDLLQSHYGELPAGQVIYNGLDASRFARSAKSPFILAAGRMWDHAKNLAAIDDAAGRISWRVYLAGDACNPDGGGEVSARHSTSLGKLDRDEMIRWLAAASIYALPARYEPFGLSVLEAALSACALVLGDIPSLREIWDDAAVFVPPDDPAQLADVLQQLIDDPPRRIDMARRAQRRATLYRQDRMAEKYLSLYLKLSRPAVAGMQPAAMATTSEPLAG